MSESQVLQGGCLCGKIRYTITGNSPEEAPEPICNIICHCANCKKATGTHMANTSMFRREQLTLILGTPGAYEDRNTESGNILTRRFCKDCGSPLYITTLKAGSIVAVPSGTLDDATKWWKPNTEVYMDTKSHWLPELPVLKKEGILERHRRAPVDENGFGSQTPQG
ncbi:hypothetical protein VP1G_11001 [Cytospora mali]|uniref:CENP-V/GFA domain-containing protein n=1 Tax=Cytospora mali TaxID=578113 RepID=A0A194V4Q2_CYTMA|nr:hypothetical protein VP1G_11001 [Valsa mali var. pyri (nom. inval.)]